jgi:DNA polymerase-1
MSKLVLIDGNAILHRAYHALPPLTTPNKEPINAVYGFVSMLLKVIQDLKPSHLAVAFDRPEPTFRHKEFKAYQAQRPEVHADLISQFAKAHQVVQAFGIPIYDKKGFEADDVIGTIAQKSQTDETVVVTGDRDLLQLVTNKIKLYMPVRGLADAKLFGLKEAEERMEVIPEQIVDFKALVGDQSDNYKGVPGIGPKTASSLLKEYGSLEDIYKNLDKISLKTKELLKKYKASAFQSQKLAQIVKDVKIDFDLTKSAQWQVDSPQINKLFDEFGFRTLKQRVEKVGKKILSEKQEKLF